MSFSAPSLHSITSALKLSERTDGDGLTWQGPRLLGHSAPMRQLREMIARVARSQAPVHIAGESGTGKDLAARTIHALSARARGPFVVRNVGAMPETIATTILATRLVRQTPLR